MATFAQPPAPTVGRASGAMQGSQPRSGAAGRGRSGAGPLAQRAGVSPRARLSSLRASAAQRGASALDALLAAAQPEGATADALNERPRWLPRIEGRTAVLLGAGAVALLALMLT